MAGTTRKPSRRFKALLFVSLAFNLVILGLVAGAALRFGGGDDHKRGHGPRFDPVLWAFDRDDRREIGRKLHASHGARQQTRKQLDVVTREMVVILQAEPFDQGALEDAVQRRSAVMLDMRDRGAQAIVAHILRMTPAERQAFALRIEDNLTRNAARKRKKEH